MNTRTDFFSYLRNLPPTRKERWVWGLSAIGIFLVLLVGWASFGSIFPREGGASALGDPQGVHGDVPVFEAIRGGFASILEVAENAFHSLTSLFSASHTYTVTPKP